MTDPAVEAAQRYAATLPFGFHSRLTGAALVFAAREALAPIRELHRPHDRTKSPYHNPRDPHTIVCNHCLGPINWPCATARLIYREDEL